MGLLGAIGAGLAEVGGTAEKIGMEGIRAAIEADRDARLNDMRDQADLRNRARNKADAEEERKRVAGLINKPVEVNQGDGMLGPATDDPAELAQTTREPTARERQSRLLEVGDLPNAERMGKDADRSEDNALNAKKLDEAARRQDAWSANEAAKRENEAKRIEAMFARIGGGKEKTPSRVAEATQIMEKINEERVAAGKPKITFEDALQMHYKSADPAKETVTYMGNDPVPTERKVTRPVGSKEDAPRRVVKFGELK